MAENQIVSHPMDILNYPTLMTYSHILTAAPAGPAFCSSSHPSRILALAAARPSHFANSPPC